MLLFNILDIIWFRFLYPLCLFVFLYIFQLEPLWLCVFSVAWMHTSSRTSVVAVLPRSCHRLPLPYRLRNEPVVMVWSAHSHIGRWPVVTVYASCGQLSPSGGSLGVALPHNWSVTLAGDLSVGTLTLR